MNRAAWLVVVSVVRKVILAAAIVAVTLAVLRYRVSSEPVGRGDAAVPIIFFVWLVITVCSVAMFLASTGLALALVLDKKPSWMHWLADAILFCSWCGLAVFGVANMQLAW